MPGEETTTQQTTTSETTQPLGNSTETRNPDGSQKDLQAPTEAKTETTTTEKPKDQTTSTAKDGKAEGAPEKYEAFKVPEGYELDTKVAEEAGKLFKDMNLSQDAAQKLVDFYSAKSLEAQQAPYKMWQDMQATWQQEVFKDSKLGTGTELRPEVKANIGRLIDMLPADQQQAFRQTMDLTGAGNNIAFVRAMNQFAEMLGEGKGVTGKGPSPLGQGGNTKPQSAAQAIFPNLPSSNRG